MANPSTPNSLQIRKQQHSELSSLRDQESPDPQVLFLRDLVSFWLPLPGNKERSSAHPPRCVCIPHLHPSVVPAPLPQPAFWLSLPDSACLCPSSVSSFSLPSFRPVSFFPLSLPPLLPPLPTPPCPYFCFSLPLPSASLLSLPPSCPICSHCPCTDLSCCLMCCLSPIVSLRVSTSPCVFPPKSSVSLIGMTNAMRARAVSGGKSCGNGWNGPVGGSPHSPELFIALVA